MQLATCGDAASDLRRPAPRRRASTAPTVRGCLYLRRRARREVGEPLVLIDLVVIGRHEQRLRARDEHLHNGKRKRKNRVGGYIRALHAHLARHTRHGKGVRGAWEKETSLPFTQPYYSTTGSPRYYSTTGSPPFTQPFITPPPKKILTLTVHPPPALSEHP